MYLRQFSTGQLIQNVGGAGRIVNKVCVQVENKKPGPAGIINNYGSDSPLITATSTALSLQISDTMIYSYFQLM
jgi:hypothetical protein